MLTNMSTTLWRMESDFQFDCDHKSERLIEAGSTRIQNIIKHSRIYDDDILYSLQEKMDNNTYLTISCHKSCVSTYTTIMV